MRLLLLLTTVSLFAMDPQDPEVQREWYDAGAEISAYDITQVRYGEARAGQAVLIYVTEPLDLEDQVKSDDPDAAAAVPGFKLNKQTWFRTGIYPYATMLTVLHPLQQAHAIKTTTSVTEWCGQAFEQFNRAENAWVQRLFSYFQSEGDQRNELPLAWLEDEVWTLIRTDPDALPTGAVDMIPGTVWRRFIHRDAEPAATQTSWSETDRTRTYTITYGDVDRSLAITIERAFPYRIIGWREAGMEATTEATLRGRVRGYYWQQNGTGAGRAELRELGLID